MRRGHVPDDRRATAISLTAAGATLAERAAGELAPAPRRSRRHEARTTARPRSASSSPRSPASGAQGVITVNRSCLTCHHFQAGRPPAPAHCHLLDLPLADRDLRVDCPEHVAAEAA